MMALPVSAARRTPLYVEVAGHYHGTVTSLNWGARCSQTITGVLLHPDTGPETASTVDDTITTAA